jgi:hypothetical protein
MTHRKYYVLDIVLQVFIVDHFERLYLFLMLYILSYMLIKLLCNILPYVAAKMFELLKMGEPRK